eukprot:PhM_4_TR1443/c0_g1_i1/m.63226/K08333/PIK3R4, VPS15; phosphoinositide-3-kinase, regulatory subunit 4
MGNQLVVSGAALEVNIAGISDALDMKAPLGKRKGRLFKALHCAHSDGGEIVAKVFLKRQGDTQQIALLRRHKEKLEAIQDLLSQFRLQKPTAPWNVAYYTRMIDTDKDGGACCLMRPYFASSLPERMLTRPFLRQEQKLFVVYQVLQAVGTIHKLGVGHGDLKTENVMVTSGLWVYITDIAPFKPTFIPANNPADFTYYFDTSEERYCFLAPERFYDSTAVPTDVYVTPTEQMDMFSVGCIAAQLITEDPFLYLPQVLSIRKSDFDLKTFVEKKIPDEAVSECVLAMLSPDPAERPTAAQLIERFTPTVFPRHFGYTFGLLSTMKPLPPDVQLTSLWSTVHDQVETVKKCHYSAEYATAVVAHGFGADVALPDVLLPDELTDGAKEDLSTFACIISNQVCVALRNARLKESRVRGLRLLLEWSEWAHDDVRIFQFIPNCVRMLHDPSPLIRSEAVRTLAHIGLRVGCPPSSASKLYEEYIFPELFELRRDRSTLVKVAYAEVLPKIALSARRFLEKRHSGETAVSQGGTYDSQLHYLRTVMWNHAHELVTDDEVAVAQAMLTDMTTLAASLGRDFTNQNLMPILLTLMSRPPVLRQCLFKQLCKLVAFVGLQHFEESMLLVIVKNNGLTDNEPLVVCEAIDGVTTLCKLGILSTPTVVEIAERVAPLMIHPNRFVRKAAIKFIACIPQCVDVVDMVTFVLKPVRPFLEFDVMDLSMLQHCVDVVREAVPRDQFQRALDGDVINAPWYPLMETYLREVSRPRSGTIISPNSAKDGVRDSHVLRDVRNLHRVKEALWDTDFFCEGLTDYLGSAFKPNPRQQRRLEHGTKASKVKDRRRESESVSRMPPPSRTNMASNGRGVAVDSHHPIAGLWCQSDLHKGPIYDIAAYDTSFVTACGDGTLRLWNVSDVLRQYCLQPRTRFAGLPDQCKVISTCFVADGERDLTVCAGTDIGAFRCFNVETGMCVGEGPTNLPENVSGFAAISSMPGTGFILAGTHSGHLIGMDVRQKSMVWCTQMERQYGAITSLLLGCGSRKECHWMATGTLNGHLSLWDLRYRLNVFTVPMPRPDASITALHGQGNQPTILVSCGGAEVLKVNLEAYRPDMDNAVATKSMVVESYLPSPELGAHAVRAIAGIPDSRCFLTGGNDRRIRFWDPTEINNSYTVSGIDIAHERQPRYMRVAGPSGGCKEVREEVIPVTSASTLTLGSLDRTQEHAHHRDAVTALHFLNSRDVPALISGSRDGMIKLWNVRTALPVLI